MKNFYLAAFLFLFATSLSFAQSNYWKEARNVDFRETRFINPDKYLLFTLDWDGFMKQTKSAIQNRQPLTMAIPQPNGSFANFELTETSIFEAELSRKYPGYTSFTGRSKDLPGGILKMSISPFGVNILIMTPDNGESIFIDPIDNQFSNQVYQVYYRKDFNKKDGRFSCGVEMSNAGFPDHFEDIHHAPTAAQRSFGDCQLRSYRVALACTGEYATFHGGTVERVLAAYNTTMTRVIGIYERDLGITMKLIANTDQLIFLNASSDPYSNNDGEAMLRQNQQTIDRIIGTRNYDFGHVFSTGGGGIAYLNGPCNTNDKAKGVTGQSTPIGDPFDVDYVAHEMGHQFGADHTQNNNCNRNNPTAVEPGSASTIMGYAGICPPDVQRNSDGYFNGISINEIQNYVVRGYGNTCATYINVSNSKPTLTVAQNTYNIPVSTSFALTAIGADAEDDLLTYSWEQTDSKVATMPPKANSTGGPLFRSVFPTNNPTRYFPDLQKRYGQWEVLPSVTRTLNFKCTVRDNHPLNGCNEDIDVVVKVSDTAGPFVVLNPNTTFVNWPVGTKQPVSWDVAKTNQGSINCQLVSIYLSIDGGITYPYLVIDSIPNTGTAEITVPSYPTNKARIMVKAMDNIFFDVSDANFKITSTFSIKSDISELIVCDEDVVTVDLKLEQLGDLKAPIHLRILPPYDTIVHEFSDNDITDLPSKVTLSLIEVNKLVADEYTIVIEGRSGEENIKTSFSIIKGLASDEIVLKAPANFAPSVNPRDTYFTWGRLGGIKDYLIEVSNTTSFDNILFSSVVSTNQTTFYLKESTIYFWRVKPNSHCVDLPYSETFSFRTSGSDIGKPIILSNETLLVDQGKSASLTDKELNVLGNNPEFIHFTFLNLPVEGSISKNNILFPVGGTFSMADILNGTIVYNHFGGLATTDTFRLSAVDDQGRWLPNIFIPIKIRTESLGVAAYRTKTLKCYNDEDATVSLTGFGGLPPYSFSKDGNIFLTDSTFAGLKAGTYIFYIKDANDEVMQSDPVVIINPKAISIEVENTFYDLKVNATGGTGSLEYSLDNSDYSNQFVFTNPGNGVHLVSVRDIYNCTAETSYVLDIPELSVESKIISDAVCFGDNIIIKVKAKGGFPPYLYSIDNQNFTLDTVLTTKTGNPLLKVSDASGKISTFTITTKNPLAIEATFDIKKFTVTILAKGGTGPLSYSRNGTNFSNDNVLEFSDNGTYRIYIRDSVLCRISYNLQVNSLKNVNVTSRDVTCKGKEDGYIKLVNQGGTAPIVYKLNEKEFSTTREWSNLKAGLYNYVVKDSKGDSLTGEITIAEPEAIEMKLIISKDTLEILATGGTPPYKYSIDNGALFLDTNIYTELEPKEYTVVVKDINGCSVSGTALIVKSKDYSLSSITIYPNPASEEIHIFGEGLNSDIEIYNMNGIRLHAKTKNISDRKATLDISDLSSGIYLIQLKSNQGIVQAKFVKY